LTSANNDPAHELSDGISHFEPGNLQDTDIHSREEKSDKESGHPNAENFVYDRKVECPVCFSNIKVKAVKSSAVRIISRDSDFMTHYGEPNPAYYDVWLCTNCGYAALSNKFDNVSDLQRKLIKEKISSRWVGDRSYPNLYTPDIAIEMHQLALLNAIVKEARESDKAMICLKTAWLYRLKKDEAGEKRFLQNALEGFINAFEKEPFPVCGMDGATLKYLIGELYRRLGDTSNALLWFSRVLSDRNAKPKIKDMARDQKDLIRVSEK